MGGYNEVNNDNHKEVILGKISKRIAGGVGALTLLGSGIIAPFAVFAEGEPMVDAGNCFEAEGNTYATFGAARDALGTEGGEIKLVCDAETDKYFGANKPNITFDLNGHAYTTTKRGFQVKGAYTFTIKDSVGGGSLTAGEAAVDLYNGAKMILEGGDIYASDWGIIVFHDSEFVMNGANHRMDGVTTYPFYIMGGDWGSAIAPVKDELPLKGDTVVGNDVWIGQNVTVMPGVHIGDGAIIGANSVVASDIPPYAVAAGNPCRVIRKRFDDEFIAYLLELKWWDWDIEKIEANFEALSSGDLTLIKKIGE